jgi:hypothetical protein
MAMAFASSRLKRDRDAVAMFDGELSMQGDLAKAWSTNCKAPPDLGCPDLAASAYDAGVVD